jgi:D-alanyl-D-alanine dipeptidase
MQTLRLKPILCTLVLLPWIAAAQRLATEGWDKASPRPVVFSQRNEAMVDIVKACPGVCVELRYATDRNLAHKAIYPPHARALIRKSVAKRLLHAQDELHRLGYGLKIWDAYRPAWAQQALWDSTPHPQEFLADPARGGSYHTWGGSVDVTLVDRWGHEQKMASDFDELNLAAKSEYAGTDPSIASRMKILRSAMIHAGFNGIRDEWWHFTSKDSYLFAPVDMSLEEAAKN